ncbi:ankyrin repeat domain-containing protein 16-like [Saccoglossus kowalevskii]
MNEQLLKSAQQGDLHTLKQVLGNGNDVADLLTCFHDKSGDTVAHLAARHGHVEVLRFLGEHGACFETGNLDGKRAIHEAALYGQTDCLKYLLSQNVTVDSLKRADWTPLMLACTKANLEVVQELIQNGANQKLRNKDGWNCFHIAAREGHVDILNYLLNCDENTWNTISKNGRTPLHTAALHGNTEAAKIMIHRCHYQVDMVDSCGSTPLMDSLRVGYVDIADLLIMLHKADVHKGDILGRQAIHLASQSGCVTSLNFLINNCNVSVNIQTIIGCLSPLHLAAKEGHVGAIDCLICHNADVNITDSKGRTALHMAVGGQHFDCVEELLKNGAIDITDINGTKPSELTNKLEICQLFKKYTN